MPQSLASVYVHAVFSTKDRRPFLRHLALRESLHGYLGAVSKKLECAPLRIGGVEDHGNYSGAKSSGLPAKADWMESIRLTPCLRDVDR